MYDLLLQSTAMPRLARKRAERIAVPVMCILRSFSGMCKKVKDSNYWPFCNERVVVGLEKRQISLLGIAQSRADEYAKI